MTARGISNKNPGNIEYSARMFVIDPWVGEVGIEKHRNARFTTFKDEVYGIRALAKVLLTYHHKRRAKDGSAIDTVKEIIDRWAPPIENDTDAYAASVRDGLDVEKGELIDLDDVQVLLVLVKAIIKHENGEQPYTDELIIGGIAMAGFSV